MKLIQYYYWKDEIDWGGWVRIFGYGLYISTSRLLFSERIGATKVIRIGRINIKLLGAYK